jgi:hypothetical protein
MVLAACLLPVADAQTSDPPRGGALTLRLQPRDLVDGVPLAFHFELINTADHDVYVPVPTIQCEDSFDGSISLSVNFRPLWPGPPPEGHGCAGDRMDWPPILRRIADWKVLHPGDSLSLEAGHARLFYDPKQPGTYEFRATYRPPSINAADQAILRQAGIDFPTGLLTTSRFTFEKRP